MEYTISIESANERVRRGAAWLDKNYPGWRDKVEIYRFDITNTCRCILGQIFADEAADEDMILVSNGEVSGMGFQWFADEGVLSRQELAEYGFDSMYLDSEQEWAYLQEAWTDELKGQL